jgi:putative spermidine/putrescine transport system ATP-binding protein
MSDRLAVFNFGRIEQVGPPSEIYEAPSTEFVAGFVGISNLIGGSLGESITGIPATFSVRPEKIHLEDPGIDVPAGMYGARGTIHEVTYLGMYTRYTVALEAGGELTVAKLNLESTSMDVLEARGRGVQLMWEKVHTRFIAGDSRTELPEPEGRS